MVDSFLKKEFDWYVQNQDELVKKYDSKVLAIKNQEVIGVFESFEDSLKIFDNHEYGLVMFHKCGPGEDNYIAKFYSPVFS